MKKISNRFKKKVDEEKLYMIMGDNNLPLWVLPLPPEIDMDTEDEPKELITNGEDK